MLSFEAPQFLYLLLALPLAGFLFWTILRFVESVRKRYRLERLSQLSHVSSRFLYIRLIVWFVLGGASLIFALAEPQLENERSEPIYKKLNVVFVLDTSLSMQSRDITPSRLKRASQEIQNLILHSGENIGQIGLVSFSGSSTILSYLTRDPSNILFYLEYLEADLNPSYGTDVGSAIKNSLALFQKEKELDDTLQASDFVLILISDGEDHGKLLQEQVEAAAKIGLKIYSLGLGTKLGGYIPIGERRGRTLFLQDERGERVLATFDEATLRGVAESTGGRYYRSLSGRELQQNLNEILLTERKAIGQETLSEKRPLHYWFILAGVLALGIFLLD